MTAETPDSQADGKTSDQEFSHDVFFVDADSEDHDYLDSPIEAGAPGADEAVTEEEAGWLSRLSTNVASTARAVWDIPANLRRNRPAQNLIRRVEPTIPVGARQVSHGVVDDLWQARPTLDRPYPVVMLHGTISSKNVWQNLVLRLRNDGFVVFAPDYGMHGTQDIPTSAQDVGAYIEQVLAATGAEQVDIVAHSQGGLLARFWINELGGDEYVHHLVTLGSTHHGTTPFGMLGSLMTRDSTLKLTSGSIRRVFGEAGLQQVSGSPLLETMSASPDTRPEVLYTCFASRNDTTVVPHERAFLSLDEQPPVVEQPTPEQPNTDDETTPAETSDAEGSESPVPDSADASTEATDDSESTLPDIVPAVFQPDSQFRWLRNFYLQDLGVTKVLHEHLPADPQVHNIVHCALLWGLRELPDAE